MHFVLAPHHSRAQNNRKYYEKILKEQANEDGDIQKDDENVRDYRHSEEFMTYEKLCRGEETKVCIVKPVYCNDVLISHSLHHEKIFVVDDTM